MQRGQQACAGASAPGGQQQGLSRREHGTLARMNDLGDRERPAMEMTLAARNALPGALTQLVGKDADMAPMGVPSGELRTGPSW